LKQVQPGAEEADIELLEAADAALYLAAAHHGGLPALPHTQLHALHCQNLMPLHDCLLAVL
jgi:hypothetical protein